MSDGNKKIAAEGLRTFVERGAAGLAALGAAAVGGPIAGVAVGAGTSGLVAFVREHAQRRTDARRDQLFAEAAARIEEKFGSGLDQYATLGATADEAMYQGLRAALDAVDPVVIPALASLVANYVDRPLDAFFRGAARTLQDLTHGEFAELSALIAGILHKVPATAADFSLSSTPDLGGNEGCWTFTVGWPLTDGIRFTHRAVDRWTALAPDWKLLFHKLKTNGLADDLPATHEVKSGPQSLSMLRAIAVRLDAHLSEAPRFVDADDPVEHD